MVSPRTRVRSLTAAAAIAALATVTTACGVSLRDDAVTNPSPTPGTGSVVTVPATDPATTDPDEPTPTAPEAPTTTRPGGSTTTRATTTTTTQPPYDVGTDDLVALWMSIGASRESAECLVEKLGGAVVPDGPSSDAGDVFAECGFDPSAIGTDGG
jgi:hypothetical protein